MENDLKKILEETLIEHGKIKFDLTYVTKGYNVEIEIGDKSNEECGVIYDQLSEWLGYDVFIEYLLNHDVYCNFRGYIEIFRENVLFNVELYGDEYGNIDLNKDLISETLGIDLISLGINDFEDGDFRVSFVKSNNQLIEKLELSYYFGDWKNIELDENQTIKLSNFLENEIEDSLPSLNFDFDCFIEIDITCQDNSLIYYYQSSAIEIKLSDII